MSTAKNAENGDSIFARVVDYFLSTEKRAPPKKRANRKITPRKKPSTKSKKRV